MDNASTDNSDVTAVTGSYADDGGSRSGETAFRLLLIGFGVAAVLVTVGYTVITGHVWEDFFITFRCSENLTSGNGLVYEAGKRIHAFTSPLGVLLPALCHWLTRCRSYLAALWCFRLLFCVPAFVGAGLLVLRLTRKALPENWFWPGAFLAAAFVLDIKAVMFSMNGMETALVLFFLAWSLNGLLDDGRTGWLLSGLAWGGMMWARPDGCVYIAAMGLAALAFPFEQSSRRDVLVGLLKSAGVAALVYLPWFLWAWAYYGTPVPHTVYAKSAVNDFSWLAALTRWPSHAAWAFCPVYPAAGASWPRAIIWSAYVWTALPMAYWVFAWKLRDKIGGRLSLVFFIASFYLAAMEHPYPWYYPPLSMIGALVWCLAAGRIVAARHGKIVRGAVVLALLLFLADMFSLALLSTRQMALQQRLIEDGVRRHVGLWLRDHVKKGGGVYLECLGYIGYFSGARMLDYPGLASPEVVNAVKKDGPDMVAVLLDLSPEWAVLRYGEALRAKQNPEFCGKYKYQAHFSAVDQLEKLGPFPGVEYLEYDATFVVYKKIPDTNHHHLAAPPPHKED